MTVNGIVPLSTNFSFSKFIAIFLEKPAKNDKSISLAQSKLL